MKIAVCGTEDLYYELSASMDQVHWKYVKNFDSLKTEDADVYFVLDFIDGNDLNFTTKPVFVNSVDKTLAELGAAPNIIRFNGWPGFLKRKSWELAGHVQEVERSILNMLLKDFIQQPDVAGFVSARIIAMIINEAFYAIGEDVGTPDDINTAMKLGTNYPLGPFEWAQQIGEQNVLSLLQKLSSDDIRYQPAPALISFCDKK